MDENYKIPNKKARMAEEMMREQQVGVIIFREKVSFCYTNNLKNCKFCAKPV